MWHIEHENGNSSWSLTSLYTCFKRINGYTRKFQDNTHKKLINKSRRLRIPESLKLLCVIRRNFLRVEVYRFFALDDKSIT